MVLECSHSICLGCATVMLSNSCIIQCYSCGHGTEIEEDLRHELSATVNVQSSHFHRQLEHNYEGKTVKNSRIKAATH